MSGAYRPEVFDADRAADDILRRCPPPPLTEWQKRLIVSVVRDHYADKPTTTRPKRGRQKQRQTR